MKILVLSDSHSGRSFMCHCIDQVQPDHVIHLGDLYEDGQVLSQMYEHIRFHQVPGNCDSYRADPYAVDILCYDIGGVRIFMTHGHKHGVKSELYRLIDDAQSRGSQIALFGHTHQPVCFSTDSGMWVMNPGSCRSWDGSVGLVEIEDGKISACRIIRQADLQQD